MTQKISGIYVPHSGSLTSKLWFIGEAPGETEERGTKENGFKPEPFIGASGQLLRETLLRNGISPLDCYFTNLSHYRPQNNAFDLLINSDELTNGIQEILLNIEHYKPNLIVLVGRNPLNFLIPSKDVIAHWRGSILELKGIKCIPILHPAGLLHNEDPILYPIFDKDIQRIAKESKFPELNIPELNIHIDPGLECLDVLLSKPILSCDIESLMDSTTIICVGFGISPTEAYVIPYDSPYSRTVLASILSAKEPKKVFHNGSFDTAILSLNGFRCEGYTDDTIIQSHILDPEFPRNLGFLTSIYTRIPYYKTEGRSHIPSDTKVWSQKRSREELYIYNGRDCCATFDIYETLKSEIISDGLSNFYAYEMQVNEMLCELSQNGLLVDLERLNLIRVGAEKQRSEAQAILNLISGQDINAQGKKTLPDFLYRTLNLPIKKKYDRKKKVSKETTEQKAIVQLIGYAKARIEEYKTSKKKEEWEKNLLILGLILKVREKAKLISSYLDITLHEGRAKSSFRTDGTETGRCSAKKFVDGSGLNLMTIPRGKVEV